MKTLKKIAIAIGALVLLLVLLVVGFGLYFFITESGIKDKATAFCDSVLAGRPTTGIVEQSQGLEIRAITQGWKRLENEQDELQVVFPGAVPRDGYLCTISAKDNRVISSALSRLD